MMPFFHYEPRKTKPPELDPVCKACDMYDEDTRPMGYLRRMMYGNPFMTFSFRRCKHHPNFCDPSDPVKCPYTSYFGGGSVLMKYCDICKRDMYPIDPLSTEANTRMDQRDEEGKSIIDVCDSCRSKGF